MQRNGEWTSSNGMVCLELGDYGGELHRAKICGHVCGLDCGHQSPATVIQCTALRLKFPRALERVLSTLPVHAKRKQLWHFHFVFYRVLLLEVTHIFLHNRSPYL
ncbi:hypothetical protein FNV43_RR23931 [Rhamnella rubrinervis]|uniref:Uncharacterized protein n=1 Tax=Rhamnella rubrinervis TaxID=2594499 RepID=A0A8K0DRI5_9ROSA|nr:hypothetical protein FNV43_RR23931 [Rhamnella rubrinervis]